MDGGVGGSWQQLEYAEIGGQRIALKQLPDNQEKPLDL